MPEYKFPGAKEAAFNYHELWIFRQDQYIKFKKSAFVNKLTSRPKLCRILLQEDNAGVLTSMILMPIENLFVLFYPGRIPDFLNSFISHFFQL